MATINPNDDFDAEDACKRLKDAMGGFNKDEDTIIQVVAGNSNEQRQEMKTVYKTLFGEDLEKELKSALRGDFQDAILALMTPPDLFDAKMLREAMKGIGTDDTVLIEILVPRSNERIEAIKEAYKQEFDRDLEEDLEGSAGGSFEKFLVSLASAGRDESEEADPDKAMEDAQAIYDAGEGRFGTDESVFNMVLCSRSVAQLRATFVAYNDVAGNTIEDAIKSETKGSLEDGYLATVACVKNLTDFYAQRINKAMKGLGTDEAGLTRVMVGRSEIDLADVKDYYPEVYEKSLAEAISKECKGDLRKLMLAIIGEEEV